MKFTLAYPKARHREETAPGIVYLDRLMDCRVCGDQTHFASISDAQAVCSSDCARRLLDGHPLDCAA